MRVLLPGCSRHIGARLVAGDLLDGAGLQDAVSDVGVVLNLAATRGDFGIADHEYRRDNFDTTREAIRAGCNEGMRR